MRIPSREIPQADVIDDVAGVALAVAAGATRFQEIANAISKVARQGRYYRLAAEILGLVSNENNHAVLTGLGQRYIVAGPSERGLILRAQVANTPVFQRVLLMIEASGGVINRDQLVGFLHALTEPTTPKMVERRAGTLTAWLSRTGLVELDGTVIRLVPQFVPGDGPLVVQLPDEPLLPRPLAFQEYEVVSERARAAARTIEVFTNTAAAERADNAHRRLVNLVSQRLRTAGVIPKANSFVDLAGAVGGNRFFFEMKSITPENSRTQIRRGLSQLYEYRFLQNVPDASLVLVVETALPQTLQWMVPYLEDDRNIHVVWDGDNELYAREESRAVLSFLWPAAG